MNDKIVFLNNLTSTISRFFNFFIDRFSIILFINIKTLFIKIKNINICFSTKKIFAFNVRKRVRFENESKSRARTLENFCKKKKFDENRDNKSKTYVINEKKKSNTIKIEKKIFNENRANKTFYSQKLNYYNSNDEKKKVICSFRDVDVHFLSTMQNDFFIE